MSMAFSRAASAYADIGRHSGVEAASPHRLIEMLYEGALDRIARARGKLMRADVSGMGQDITRALRIIEGLRMSLDRSSTSELAANLDDLYDYLTRRLLQASAGRDVGMLDECSGLLRTLSDAWSQIPMNLRHGAPAGATLAAVGA